LRGSEHWKEGGRFSNGAPREGKVQSVVHPEREKTFAHGRRKEAKGVRGNAEVIEERVVKYRYKNIQREKQRDRSGARAIVGKKSNGRKEKRNENN